ncbi:MAG TPA: hypothetical protein VJ743_22020 [Albitalea sp.]|nr:hypothetical protein [Albitalea sp.]
MSAERSLDLLREVLDHEVVDADEVSCGMVDDLEFVERGRGLELEALLLGPGAWGPRLPALAAWLAGKLFGRRLHRVPWSEVIEVSEVIRLRSAAATWGLGELDRKVGRWLAHLTRS